MPRRYIFSVGVCARAASGINAAPPANVINSRRRIGCRHREKTWYVSGLRGAIADFTRNSAIYVPVTLSLLRAASFYIRQTGMSTLMSALGQKQTCAVRNVMSALATKADIDVVGGKFRKLSSRDKYLRSPAL